jgi:predicted O-methyltransferase YrrM
MLISPEAKTVLDRLYADDARQRAENLPTPQRTRNLNYATGEFVNLLAKAVHAKRILEIGSSNGVSTLWWGLAMAETGGKVTGTELIPERAAEANANLKAAGLEAFAHVLAGPAGESVKRLDSGFDILFIDAEKEDYPAHFAATFPLLRVGGIMIADNVISHDLSDFQQMLRARSDVQASTVPIGQGIEIALKLA